MTALRLITHGSTDYLRMVDLRYEILRKPLGLTFSPMDLAKEKHDILIGAFKDEVILGCCILSKREGETLRLRQMAVQVQLQGKGIGASILSFAENFARSNGYKVLRMHARHNAVGFYEKLGYCIKGDPFLEIKIQHFLMEKALT